MGGIRAAFRFLYAAIASVGRRRGRLYPVWLPSVARCYFGGIRGGLLTVPLGSLVTPTFAAPFGIVPPSPSPPAADGFCGPPRAGSRLALRGCPATPARGGPPCCCAPCSVAHRPVVTLSHTATQRSAQSTACTRWPGYSLRASLLRSPVLRRGGGLFRRTQHSSNRRPALVHLLLQPFSLRAPPARLRKAAPVAPPAPALTRSRYLIANQDTKSVVPPSCGRRPGPPVARGFPCDGRARTRNSPVSPVDNSLFPVDNLSTIDMEIVDNFQVIHT